MKRTNYAFTSESVSDGRPDKINDRISDAVLDVLRAVHPITSDTAKKTAINMYNKELNMCSRNCFFNLEQSSYDHPNNVIEFADD